MPITSSGGLMVSESAQQLPSFTEPLLSLFVSGVQVAFINQEYMKWIG